MKPHLDTLLCTACHACVSVCPANCISMEPDNLGFLRPHVDEGKCLECGLCEKTCQRVKEVPGCPEQRIYAARHTDENVVKRSASGGVFTALSDVVLSQGGVIVGARYNDGMVVRHAIATTTNERNTLRGSKYTYSLCDKDIYVQVKQLVESEKLVLFSGTPCQVAALRTFLGKDYDNLLLVDILCHGIAAPVLYRDYVTYLEKANGPIEYIDFRHAPNGNWHDPKTCVTYQNRRKKLGEDENSYFRMFVRNYCLRESCYSCNYAQFDRVSDITLGDFWGIENSLPECDRPEGVSIVVTSTAKGAKMFAKAQGALDVKECTSADCTHHQLHGLQPGGRNENFVADYLAHGFAYVHKKYTTTPWSIRFREKLYRAKVFRLLRDLLKGK